MALVAARPYQPVMASKQQQRRRQGQHQQCHQQHLGSTRRRLPRGSAASDRGRRTAMSGPVLFEMGAALAWLRTWVRMR